MDKCIHDDELLSFKCSECKEIVGYAPKSIIEFMKIGGFLDTYKCTKCRNCKIDDEKICMSEPEHDCQHAA